MAASSSREVLKSDLLLLLRWNRTIAHMIKLVLGHLHELALVLNLSLGQFKGLICYRITGNYLRSILASHQEVLLCLLVFEVRVW